jgi:hypothetical protein
LIYNSLAEIEWKNGRVDECISVLVHYAFGKGFEDGLVEMKKVMDAIPILKAKVDLQLETLSDRQEFTTEMECVSFLIKNTAILLLLTSPTADLMVEFCTKVQDKCSSNPLFQEVIYQMIARILLIHQSTGYNPAPLKQFLNKGLELFPTNTCLLAFYGFCESRNRLDSGLTQFLTRYLER